MKFDQLMWAVAIVLAILNGSGVISMPWLWVAAPVILIYGLAAIYWIMHVIWMDWVETRAADGEDEGLAQFLGILLFLVIAAGAGAWAIWDDRQQKERAREEAAILARYGIEPQTWEFMTPEEQALFKR